MLYTPNGKSLVLSQPYREIASLILPYKTNYLLIMANLNKIKVGNISYNIVPQLGNGLKEVDGSVCLNIGSGITFNTGKEAVLNVGTGLVFDKQDGKIIISMGTAIVQGNESIDTGIAINEGMFMISTTAFKNYLKSLGVAFNS